jgi:hypothetical protein
MSCLGASSIPGNPFFEITKKTGNTGNSTLPGQTADSLHAKTNPAKPAGRDSTRHVSTGTAMLLSALLPGGGQFYTRNLLKGALYGGAELALAGVTVYQDRQMRQAYRAGSPDSLVLKNRRNALLWWTGAVWAFTIADAYVSASMYGFKEEQRLSVQVAPLEIGLCYRF